MIGFLVGISIGIAALLFVLGAAWAVQSRIDAIESRLPPAEPPAEAKPTTLREIVVRAAESLGLSREHMDEEDTQIMLRIVAAVCRNHAKEIGIDPNPRGSRD